MNFKLSNSVLAFIFSLNIAAVVHGATTASMSNSRSKNKYHIVVYQNARCTGEAITYSGDSGDCFDGLGSGGSGLQLLALENGGKLVFYGQPGCPDNEHVAARFIHANQTGLGCKPLSGNPVSFKFLGA
ncbi:hypothetical protein N7471_010455 [Penicillium samsonianum]|uniref:uncharacterized protein n=1 Tax=Penicillium samsonianum TaxID=1882272 RepID=UPI002548939F|nr:uncharacterized protein N7471_010455 [Penicillium samsonianum]KAJ6125962.1 hypothetical protein N7471_010455 [Penicillium samsonianum]